MSLPTTSVVHNWRKMPNKSGKYPVHLRITIDRIHKYVPIEIPVKISIDQWIGDDDNWVKDSHPFFFEINTKIRERKQLVQNLIKRYYLAGKKLNFSTIFSELGGTDHNQTFNSFFAGYIKNQLINWSLTLLKSTRHAWNI